jgi:hypothetical protein
MATRSRSRRSQVIPGAVEHLPTDETAEVLVPEPAEAETGTALVLVDHSTYTPNWEAVSALEAAPVNPKGTHKKAEAKKEKRPVILTPFQATAIVNAHRAEFGLKPVNSPMLYIYANKGKFPIEIAEDGRKEIRDVNAFYEWMVAHTARQVQLRNAKKAESKATAA